MNQLKGPQWGFVLVWDGLNKQLGRVWLGDMEGYRLYFSQLQPLLVQQIRQYRPLQFEHVNHLGPSLPWHLSQTELLAFKLPPKSLKTGF